MVGTNKDRLVFFFFIFTNPTLTNTLIIVLQMLTVFNRHLSIGCFETTLHQGNPYQYIQLFYMKADIMKCIID